MDEDGERAPRFSARLHLRYRPGGPWGWRHGRLENISRSGVLFRTPQPPEVDTPLVIRLRLGGGPGAPALVCRARVVRTVLPEAGAPRPGLAAAVSGYRVLRGLRAL